MQSCLSPTDLPKSGAFHRFSALEPASDSKSVNGEKGVEETAASFYSSLAGIYVIHGWFDWDNVVLFFDLYTIKEMQ